MYTVRSLVMVRNQLPAQVVNGQKEKKKEVNFGRAREREMVFDDNLLNYEYIDET